MRFMVATLTLAAVFVGTGVAVNAQDDFRSSASIVPSVVKMCGTVEFKKTDFDGLQTVFTRTNNGAPVGSYFLQAVSENAKNQIAGLTQDRAETACVVGVPSQMQMIDSPPDLYTFEILF